MKFYLILSSYCRQKRILKEIRGGEVMITKPFQILGLGGIIITEQELKNSSFLCMA